MTTSTSNRRPAGLGAKGARLWTALVTEYEFNETDTVVLENACRTVDLLDRLEAELGSASLLVAAPGGTSKANPLLGEVARHRSILARLLRQLGVPEVDEPEAGDAETRSDKARRAARARWGTR